MTASQILTAAFPATGQERHAGQPRAVGRVSVSAKRRDGRSALDRLHQAGSMKALFPRASGPALNTVLLNTAGGITGGDRFDIRATAGPHTHAILTTQAAERGYRAQPGEVGQVRTHLTVTAGARLDWLPQETILFDGSAIDRRLAVDMDDTGRLLIVEPLIFGRAAMGERLAQAQFSDRIDIRRDGHALFADRTKLDGAVSDHLRGPAIAGGAGAMATVFYAGPDADRFLAPARDALPAMGGASLIRDGLLVARLLAADGFALRTHLIPLIGALTPANLPRTWTI
ncbi:MAG: urease accessory protein UreD [Marinibacterium sp.]